MSLDEWCDIGDEHDDQDTSKRGKHPSYGLPGKLTAAQNHAPPDATDEEIRDVAEEAFDRGVKVQVVWRDRMPCIGDY